MLHKTPPEIGQIDVPQSSPNGIPFMLIIPEKTFDSIIDVATDNDQTIQETILAKLETFLNAPLFITVDPKSLEFMYYPTGKSVAQAIGPVKSVRLEVLK